MSQPSQAQRTAKKRGFTIIEVMIVLAIAGLIMLIVFLIVPTVQRNARNYGRKNYASLVTASMLEFYNNYGHYPQSSTEICTFLHSLPQATPGATCPHSTQDYLSINGDLNEDCDTVQAGPYTVCYQDWNGVDHGYIGPPDEISIMLAHWCNSGDYADPAESATKPIAGDDTNLKRFVVWTPLEGVQMPLCLDSIPDKIP